LRSLISNPVIFSPDARRSKVIHSQYLRFSGVRNFRDLGGYVTGDGRMVRTGLLYRSGNLHRLTDKDLKRLTRLSLRKIIDFRSEFEKTSEPDRLPSDFGIDLVEIPILDRGTDEARSLEQQIKEGKVDNIHPEQFLMEANVQLATRFTPQYRQFVHQILEANGGPTLFHCTAGKDRTGFAAAILLRILGVSQEAVMSDYLLSNQYYFKSLRPFLWWIALTQGQKTARVIRGFLEVRPVYLSNAFESIDWHYGSFDSYLRRGLELTQDKVEKLRRLYLQA